MSSQAAVAVVGAAPGRAPGQKDVIWSNLAWKTNGWTPSTTSKWGQMASAWTSATT